MKVKLPTVAVSSYVDKTRRKLSGLKTKQDRERYRNEPISLEPSQESQIVDRDEKIRKLEEKLQQANIQQLLLETEGSLH